MRIKAIVLSLALVIDFSIHAITVKVFSGSVGAEVSGIDLSQGIEKEEISLIRQLLHDRLVIVVKNQNLSAEQQVFVTSLFGDVEIAWDKKNRHINDCHVHVINNGGAKKNPNYVSSTYFWHWDKSFIRYPTSISFAFFQVNLSHKEWALQNS